MPFPPILCYHKIDPRLEPGVTRLAPRVFSRQVGALARAKVQVLGTADLLELAEMPSTMLAYSAVALTFDDGYAGLADHAFPALAEHGMRALVFVITDYVGADNAWDLRLGGRSFPHMDWDTLGRWHERGMEVHAHGATHRRLTWLPDDAVAEELGRSMEAIRSRLGHVPAGFCYPFGAVDARVRRLAAAAGYRLGFAGIRSGTPADPLQIARLPVYPWDRLAPPAIMRSGALGGLMRWGARAANRMSVVTSLVQRRRR